jgi:hypothetical protein
LRKDAAALRHVADARGARACTRASFTTSSSSNAIAAGVRGVQADDRAQQRRLADAVAAEQRDGLTGADGQVDAVEHLAHAVGRADVRKREHRSPPCARPRYTASTSDRCESRRPSAVREHAAHVQHADRRRELFDEIHVVIDHDERVRPASAADQRGGRLGFLMRHAGRGLVEQQQIGIRCDDHPDLEPLLVAVRELRGGDRALRARPMMSSTSSTRARSSRRSARGERAPRAPVARRRHAQVVFDRQRVEHAGRLKFPADAAPHDPYSGTRASPRP